MAPARRVRMYLKETDRLEGKSLYLRLLERLRAEGCAGATVFRGVAGFGARHVIHTGAVVDVIPPLPIVVEWIDTPERVERVLPLVAPLVSDRMITVEDVQILHHAHRIPDRLPRYLKVSDIMTTEPVSVHPATPLAEVVQIVIDQDYRAVPVIDDDRRVVGIITNSDLVERGGLQARVEMLGALPPEALAHELAELHARGHQAAEVMTPAPVTVRPGMPVQEAVALMVERRLKRLPVVDALGHLLGMVSLLDVLRAAGEAFPALAPPSAPHEIAPQTPVREVLNPEVPVVTTDASLGEVLDAVTSTRLNRAVVVDPVGRRPVGMISDAALVMRLDPRAHPTILTTLMARLPFVHLSPEQQEAVRLAAAQQASDLMVNDIAVANANTNVSEAIRMMIARRQKVLPVIDDEGRLLGALDRADLLWAVDTWFQRRNGAAPDTGGQS